MTFRLYPEPPVRALRVGRSPAARVDVDFAQVSGTAPTDLASQFVQVMFVRVAMLTGAAPPVLSVKADSGTRVVLTGSRQPVFAQPGQTAFTGEASVVRDPDGTFVITVGLASASQHNWTLGIENTGTAADQDYTWVVADTVADTQQPWVRPTFTRVTCEDLHDISLEDSLSKQPVSVSVDSANHAAYVAVRTAAIFRIVDGQRSFVALIPSLGQIAYDSVGNKLFAAQEATSTLAVIKGGVISGSIQIGTSPNEGFPRLAVDAPNRKVYALPGIQNVATVISADSERVESLLPVGREPSCVAVDSAHDAAYVANRQDGTLSVVNSGGVVDTLPCVGGPTSVLVGNGGATVWTGSGAGPRIGITDVTSRQCVELTIRDDFHHSDFVAGLATDPARFLVYIFLGSKANFVSTLFVFDSRIATTPIQAFAPDGSRYITRAYASPATDTTSGLLHIGYGVADFNSIRTGCKSAKVSPA